MYGSYDDNVIQSGEYYGGEVLSNDYYPGVISNGVVVDNAPTMVPTTPAQ